jgi:spermidine synthase
VDEKGYDKGYESISTWQAMAIVFIASACTLVIEIIAGRMLAPYVGVNLFTWTSVIGVVLAGISLGNYVGGLLADRGASRRLLGVQFFASAVATLSILPLLMLAAQMSDAWRDVPLMLKIVAYVALVFFLPGFVLGTISPVVVKLSLHDLQRTGKTVGVIYAFSTLGSIVGTFLTGFFLISAFGTRTVVLGVAVVLLLVGVVFGDLRPRPRPQRIVPSLLLLAGAALITGMIFQRDLHKLPYLRETDYFTINIVSREMNNGATGLALVLDHLIHSFTVLDDPTFLEYGYERVYAELTQFKAEQQPNFRAAFIGGGGFTFPRYLDAVYPGSLSHVIEIDPAVTEIAYERLGLRRDARVVPFNEDARLFFNRLAATGITPDQQYDLVYGDAFNDLSVPYHLTTAEFSALVAQSLKPDGIYMVNIIDKYQSGEFMRSFMRALKVSFPHVYLMSLGETWRGDAQNTYVVVGTKQPLDLDAFRRSAESGGKTMVTDILPEAELAAYLEGGQRITLTDDYAPVDQMLAPLFVERGF